MKLLFSLVLSCAAAWTQAIPVDQLDTQGLDVTVVNYQGKQATRIVAPEETNGVVLLKDSPFRNGTIEVELAGRPASGAFEGARGFVGIAFRVQGDLDTHELIYLRPTNGRADDMLRRNHSTQYTSEPEWTWFRLRSESPGVYESYVDLETGVWTKYKIVVDGARAELYVHDADQPCLIVKDLKLGEVSGGIALWAGPGTEAFFSNLNVH